MAFRMNRPMIKGTANHKASIAKAKSESIVAQTRTQADSSLVGAADIFGKSFSPKEIEYGTNMDAFKVPTGDDKTKVGKKKTKKEKTRKENLKEEYEREHPGGTLFPNDSGGYQYYDADGRLVSKKVYDKDGKEVKKVKGPKVKKEKKPKNKLKEAKITASTDYTVNKRDLVLKGGNWVPKEGAVSKEDDRAIWDGERWTDNPKYMDKGDVVNPEGKFVDREKTMGRVYEPGSMQINAFGDQQVNQYTKAQRDRLEAEGVWSDDAEKMVLPEEIVDGKFVSKAEGTRLEPQELDYVDGKYVAKGSQDEKEVVEEKKTLSNLEIRKKRMADKKWSNPKTSQYIKDQMLKEGYVPNESKSPMEMRDNRIYRNAIKGGVVQQNMKKSGYTPE